ncbi:hypothetical protein HJC23_005265 [Cyclotella cryptica]|uniref:Nudix hydrolase domain-containing protein n=1 Tax=Cyclotella cryptica TaxID=29204 RepID=A0ABD3PLI3_9STRA
MIKTMMQSRCFPPCRNRILSHVATSVGDATMAAANTRLITSVSLGHAQLTRCIHTTTQTFSFNSLVATSSNQRWFQARSLSMRDSSMPSPECTTVHEPPDDNKRGKRVWKAAPSEGNFTSSLQDGAVKSHMQSTFWDKAIDDVDDPRTVHDSLARICEQQERQGGRMQASQLGVLREDPHEDMRLLLENYTAAALASALRDREDTLQLCADLLSNNRIDELSKILRPYEPKFIHQRRHSRGKVLDFSKGGFSQEIIELLRKGLNRMPRRVSTAHSKRAGVVLPLCNVEGVPCILFEKRSRHLRAHADEVCLPGGMVSEGGDKSIVQTCLREMEEEIGIEPAAATVLGVLRCNWGEVHHLVGVAVTPVVCFIGEVGMSQLNPNPSEVSECFTVPLEMFTDSERCGNSSC